MSPAAQRIAIAEALGFRKVSEIYTTSNMRTKWASPRRYFRPPDSDYGDKLFTHQAWGWAVPASWASDEPDWTGVPDYLNDRNAIIAAIEEICTSGVTQFFMFDFHKELYRAIYRKDYMDERPDLAAGDMSLHLMITATAAQLAVATIHALNLWVEEAA